MSLSRRSRIWVQKKKKRTFAGRGYFHAKVLFILFSSVENFKYDDEQAYPDDEADKGYSVDTSENVDEDLRCRRSHKNPAFLVIDAELLERTITNQYIHNRPGCNGIDIALDDQDQPGPEYRKKPKPSAFMLDFGLSNKYKLRYWKYWKRNWFRKNSGCQHSIANL